VRTHTHTHTHTHTEICDTCCFSTAIMVTWTRLSVTLYVHCLSCSSHITRSFLRNVDRQTDRLTGTYCYIKLITIGTRTRDCDVTVQLFVCL
jgi:hypothetical protein